MSRIAILGAGAWGTALTLSLARRGGHDLTLWVHSPALAAQLTTTRENTRYLPGFALPPHVAIATELSLAASAADTLLLVTPSHHVRETVTHLSPHLTPRHTLLIASKGLEERTHLRLSEVVASVVPNRSATLSGPSFAQEVALGRPTALVAAAADATLAQAMQQDLSSPALRVYTNDDLIGVELGGALKNVIALAAGVAHGLDLGHNAIAALLTRGIAEITRLAVASGARRETLAGLAGLGDLVLTATGSLSRNRLVGVELGRGRALTDILAAMHGKVAEGVRSTTAALGLAAPLGIDMPITEQVDAILHHGRDPRDAIRDLMTRPFRDE